MGVACYFDPVYCHYCQRPWFSLLCFRHILYNSIPPKPKSQANKFLFISLTFAIPVGNAALSVPQGFSASMDEKPYKCGMYYENQPIEV